MAEKNSSEMEDLKRELETLRKDFGKLVDSAKSASTAQAQSGVDAAKDSAERLRGHARDTAASLEEEIKARPYSSVFAAFGVGLLLGKILGR